MKYTIERVENGYMITGQHPDAEQDAIWVFEHDEDEDDAQALCHTLWQIIDVFRPISKHNKYNVVVAVKGNVIE
jgi:hypothetical protein